MTRPDPKTIQSMSELRAGIDAIDTEIVALLAERLAHVDMAPVLKPREGIAAHAPSRVQAVVNNVRAKSEASGFDADLAEAMWRIMIDAMIAREELIMGKDGVDG